MTASYCKSLHEMLEWNQENHAYKKYIADYKMNLILLNELDKTTFETGLRDLIGMMKHSHSKKCLQEYVEGNKERSFNTIKKLVKMRKEALICVKQY